MLEENFNQLKLQYDAKLEALKGKYHWDAERKRHAPNTPKQGYLTKAVREFYSNIKDVKSDIQEMKNVNKLLKHCYEKLEDGELQENLKS